MPTTVIENHHYYARCDDCKYTGPLRFRRALAETDAERHREAEHHVADPDPIETGQR